MKFVKAFIFALLFVPVAHADGITPFKATVFKKISKRSKSEKSSQAFVRTTSDIPAITFSTTLRAEGRVLVTLNVRKATNWDATLSRHGVVEKDTHSVELYQGDVTIRGVKYPAAASVIGKEMTLSFPGRVRRDRQRVYTMTIPSDAEGMASGRVRSTPAVVFHNKSCADKHVEGHDSKTHSTIIEPLNVGMKEAKLYHVITMSTLADPELYALHGSSTNAYIASIINTAEALYERQLGIRFQIVKQHVYTDIATSPVAQTNPDALLRAFATNPENPTILGNNPTTFDQDVDVKHLFTGKDLDGVTVGIAYVGSVCSSPAYAYGLTQATSLAGSPYYFAHEVGHNLGARHDTQNFASLMSPSIFIGSSFSKQSVDQINEHLFYFGSCVELKMMGPNLANAKLSLQQRSSRASIRLVGELLSSNREPLAGEKVSLVMGARSVSVSTNSAGRYSFVVKRSQIANGTKIYAMTPGGEVRSVSVKALFY
jgi:hypothetical protein